jgi:hypothetical protein
MDPSRDTMLPMAEKDFTAVFGRLRAIMAPYAEGLDVVHDVPGTYYLNTRHVRGDGYVLMFGAVQIKSRYVSYHLMPVYAWTDLLEGMSDGLRKRMQGKSCFNFTTVDEDLFAELAELTRRGAARGAGEGNPFTP